MTFTSSADKLRQPQICWINNRPIRR